MATCAGRGISRLANAPPWRFQENTKGVSSGGWADSSARSMLALPDMFTAGAVDGIGRPSFG